VKRKVWIVRPGDGGTVADIVRRAGEDERAVGEGRVFRGRRRVRSGAERVEPGDEIAIGPRRDAPDVAILFDRDGLVACIKPAGIPTVPDEGGAAHALVSLVEAKVGTKELRVTSRLDRDVSGVVLFARDAAAEEKLKRARAEGVYRRRYVAIATNANTVDDWKTWAWPIGRGRDARHRAVGGSEAKEAKTKARAVAVADGHALLALDPITGRTHQIRVHASHAGMPLLGDRDYGGSTRITRDDGRVLAIARIALHCARVAVPDAEATAPIPGELAETWAALGGAPEAWDTATSCASAS
jgi:23S rRNA-/tRNA-specific pseudouridylate synthase